MALPSFRALLGVRAGIGRSAGMPNIADGHSAPSVAIARRLMDLAEAPALVLTEQGAGRAFEHAVAAFLGAELRAQAPERDWHVETNRRIGDFAQYRHLDAVHRLIEQDQSGVLGTTIGRDYVIRPDATVSLPSPEADRLLHAAVSCKWTLRSDRAQNIRHEAVVMIRQRRGRLPHLCAVTAEPLPSRLISLAGGTGEIDAVYHPFFEELRAAVDEVGGREQRLLEEMVQQGRLHALESLPATLLAT